MKIVISAAGDTHDAQVDPRFGRCAYFAFVDPESDAADFRANEAQASGSGAGIQAAQFVVDQGAEVVVTGHVGPNAFEVLDAAGVAVYRATGMSVTLAVKAFRADELERLQTANRAAHTGMSGSTAEARSGGEAPVGAAPAGEFEALQQDVAELSQVVDDLQEKVDVLVEQEEENDEIR